MLYNTRTYTLDRYNNADSVSYVGTGHTPAAKNQLTLSRTYPKPTKDNDGVAKPYFKQVKTVVVNATTGEKKDAIVYVGGSIPVGATSTDVNSMLADVAAWVNTADAQSLFNALDINT